MTWLNRTNGENTQKEAKLRTQFASRDVFGVAGVTTGSLYLDELGGAWEFDTFSDIVYDNELDRKLIARAQSYVMVKQTGEYSFSTVSTCKIAVFFSTTGPPADKVRIQNSRQRNTWHPGVGGVKIGMQDSEGLSSPHPLPSEPNIGVDWALFGHQAPDFQG